MALARQDPLLAIPALPHKTTRMRPWARAVAPAPTGRLALADPLALVMLLVRAAASPASRVVREINAALAGVVSQVFACVREGHARLPAGFVRMASVEAAAAWACPVAGRIPPAEPAQPQGPSAAQPVSARAVAVWVTFAARTILV